MRPAILTLAITAAIFVALFVLERLLPLRRRYSSLLPRVILNLVISAAAFAVAAILVRPGAIAALSWATQKPFGLVHLLALPPALGFIASFLLMDLTFYWWHLANHRIGFLWRFHNVHHIDPDLDVSTGFRFHFGEVAMSAAFRVVQVLLIGISMPAFAVYELVFQANTLFHHSNLRLPIRLERLLNKVLVTPRMHGIHHSQVQRETNSNYGVVFPWWDRVHRTLGLNIPQAEIAIGIAGYSLPDDNQLGNALLMPFRKQRDYWRRSDGTIVERTATASPQPSSYLAE
ncbi:MAG TPA: sterol desaturase family protein [Candidatus Sulfotelmatobacter sp.]|jgi:sterol desaturase/sphingolipid hydroxylase (fatty acid hydroxylase superfamily)|nr:sterol desaturase family protein [Candidatus Sulfotelmatobacter sp.]